MQRSGFSLVELSIVLVILGLLTGGILAGQSLIRAAELRGMATDAAKYQSASMAFRDKYFAVPGDMKNATSFWGNATTGTTGGECTNPESDAGTNGQTCNGNGDGNVGYNGTTALNNSEVFRYWQHLANASLIEGGYTGVASDVPAGGTSWRVAVPGTNIPTARLPSAGFTVISHAIVSNCTGTNKWAGGDTAIVRPWAEIGRANGSDLAWDPSVKAEEAWNFDTKLDDGKPGTGAVRSLCAALTVCTTSQDPGLSEYALTSTSVSCTPVVDMKI